MLTRRLEHIILDECHRDLGATYYLDNANGLYDYLYYYSKNRPVDSEISIGQESKSKH